MTQNDDRGRALPADRATAASQSNPSVSSIAGIPSAWQDISTAPRNRVIMLYGPLDVLPDRRQLYGDISESVRATGYWDAIDGAWSLVGGTWEGPWIKATRWQEAPEAPHD